MDGTIRQVMAAVPGKWTEYDDGRWTGADLCLGDGGTLRLAREGSEGEHTEAFRFDPNMMLIWQASFSYSTPIEVIIAALKALQKHPETP